MKRKFFYSLILASGLIFTGSSFNNVYGQKPKKSTEKIATTKHKMKYTCTMHPEVVMDKPGKCPKCGMALVVKKEVEKVKHVTIPVKGNCELCKTRIEKAAMSVKGVKVAMWEQKSQTLHLQYNPSKTTPEKVMLAVAKVGHDAGKVKATATAYKSLPSCCQYNKR